MLRDDKFSWLYWSFTLFLVGMVATAMRSIYQLADPLEPACLAIPVRGCGEARSVSTSGFHKPAGAPRPGATVQSGWQK